MAKNNYLEQRRRALAKQTTPSSGTNPVEGMSGEEIDAEIKRLQWERTKAETEYWQSRRDENAGRAPGSPQSAQGARPNLNSLKRNKRPPWR